MSSNYNTWGGKNNSWGNKNRKNSSNTSTNSSNSNNNQEPNKLFNTLAGGCCLFLMGVLGLDLLSSAVTGIKDTVDTTKQVAEVVENTVNNTDTSNNTSTSTNNYTFNIENELELEAEDIKDILEYLKESANIGNINGDEAIIIDYSALENEKTYEKKIIKRLDKFNKAVTFVLINNNSLSEEEYKEELTRVQNLVSNNIELLRGTNFESTATAGAFNYPNQGEMVISISFN